MAVSPPSRLPGLKTVQRPASGQDDSADSNASGKQSKRRSLLPHFARKMSEDKITVNPIAEDADQSASAPTSGPDPAFDEAREAMPPPAARSRASSIKPPGSSMIARSNSIRTTVLSGPARDRKASVTSTTSTSMLGRDRNLSVTSNPTVSDRPATSSGLSRTDSKRMPPSPTKRTVPAPKSLHGRSASLAKASIHSIAGPPLPASNPASRSPPNSSLSHRPTSSRSNLPPPNRPAFNTYQQHFSPTKSALPKPPVPTATSTIAIPRRASDPDTPMDLATIHAQAELLHLTLLHQTALSTQRTWLNSAHDVLAARHAALRAQLDALRTTEQDRRILGNLAVLEAWCPDAAGLAEHLHILARTVADLRALTEPGSRWAALVDVFVGWADRAERILLREGDGGIIADEASGRGTEQTPTTPASVSGSSGEMVDEGVATVTADGMGSGNDGANRRGGIEALPESWRATHTSLALKLRSLHRDVEILPPVPASALADGPEGDEVVSSLEVVLDSCIVLVKGMLKELEIMTRLQKEVLSQERVRTDELVQGLCADKEAVGPVGQDWVPAWQDV